MRRQVALVLVLAVALTGCAAVTLRHPESGAVARCGIRPVPFWYGVERARARVDAERDCVARHEQQGYQIVVD